MSNNTTSLREEVIEHAMRLGASEAAVLSLLMSSPNSTQAYATLGRLMDRPGTELTASSPLVVWCAGGQLDPHWRNHCTSAAGLWVELGDLRTMFGECPAADRYAELQLLRDRADAAITEG
jgi:hypothetical protein